MQTLVKRNAEPIILKDLQNFPVVAILGPCQCGKSILARMLKDKIEGFVFLDLESPSYLRKLDDPELFFEVNQRKTVCLDEIQLRPELFPFPMPTFQCFPEIVFAGITKKRHELFEFRPCR